MNRYFLSVIAISQIALAQGAKVSYDATQLTLHITREYSRPRVEKDSRGQLSVSMHGLPNTLGAGLPVLPYEPLRLAIPYGLEIESYSTSETEPVQTRGQVVTHRGQLPISWFGSSRRLEKTAAPDFAGAQYPDGPVQITTQKLHGVSIALVNLHPVLFLREGALRSVSRLDVAIRFKTSSGNGLPLRLHQKTEVAGFVSNPDTLNNWPLINTRGYNYLIVSTPELIAYTGSNGWNDLKTSLESKGLAVQITDSEKMLAAAQGKDNAEKLRNFIASEYQTSGIQYVLLAGKGVSSATPNIPSRALWSKIRAYMGYWFDLERNIASDHYFAALDGDFDGNQNGKWGEPTDGASGADVDFLPEITVGRAVLNSTQQLQDFVKKTVWSSVEALPRKMLLAGEELFPEMNLYGDEYMDQLIGACTDHGFATSGYTGEWAVAKLYDRPKAPRSSRAWTGADALLALNTAGLSMINHLGHSNETYNMRLSASSITKLTNAIPFFYYTQGCLAASFTAGSFVDKLVSSPNAAFAAIGNTSYGLAPEDPDPASTKTPGASQMLHRQFIHSLMASPDTTLADAHQKSKTAFVNQKMAQEVRWVTWTATYFGDPSLRIR